MSEAQKHSGKCESLAVVGTQSSRASGDDLKGKQEKKRGDATGERKGTISKVIFKYLFTRLFIYSKPCIIEESVSGSSWSN